LPSLSRFVAPVSYEDRAIVDFLCREPTAPDSCGNNWLYYLCLCRDHNQWFRYWDGQALIFITPRPGLSGAVAFIRPLGTNIPETLSRLARIYVQKTKQPVAVKNISLQQFRELQGFGFSDYKANDGWQISLGYRYDDEQYEEVVISLFPYLAQSQESLSDNKEGDPSLTLAVERLEVSSHRRDLERILEMWVAFYLTRNPKENVDHMLGVYRSFVFEPANQGWVFRVDRNTVGFIVTAPGLPFTLDFYAALYDPAFRNRGISTKMYEMAFRLAVQKGYMYAGLGGSEVKSLFDFKRSFKPHRLIKRTHAILYPKVQ